MSNILVINAHHKYPFAQGQLNGALVQMADEYAGKAVWLQRQADRKEVHAVVDIECTGSCVQ